MTKLVHDAGSRVTDAGALRESEQRFRAIFEHAGLGVVMTDGADVIIEANDAFCRMLGYSESEVIGKPSSAFMHPEEIRYGGRLRKRLWAGEIDRISVERRYLHKDGRVVWTNRTASPVFDAAGKPLYLVRIVEDITERKAAEREIERSAALTKLLEVLARTANEALTPEEAMQACLEHICVHGNWVLGRLGFYTQGENERFPQHSFWHTKSPPRFEEFMQASLDPRNFSPRGTFVTAILDKKQPMWISDIATARGFGRRPVASRAGLRSAFAFPVVLHGRVAALLEFFGEEPREPDDALLEAAVSVGAQLARLIESAHALETLRAREALYRSLFEENPLAAFVVDMQTTRLLAVNRVAINLYGYTREELLKLTIVDLQVPEDRPGVQAELAERYAAGNEDIRQIRRRHLAKDGRIMLVEVIAQTITFGTQPARLLLVNDVTERERTAEAQSLLVAIVESSSDAIVSRNEAREIVSWNAAAERLFGWTREEALGQHIGIIVPAELRGTLRDRIEQARRGALPEAIETLRLRKDGTEFHAEATFSPVRDRDGKVIAMANTYRDITERKQAEAQLHESMARERDLSRRLREVEEAERRTLARELHDRVGSNLNALILTLGLLRKEVPEAVLAQLSARLDSCSALLVETVQHTREVMANLRPPGLDELGLLAALRHHVTRYAGEGGVVIEVIGTTLDPRPTAQVEIALFRIAQEALANLVRHASTPRARLALEQDAQSLVLTVSDEGKGFSRGAGRPDSLGMSTMRERADAIGARFEVTSRRGRGTTVKVTLPRGAQPALSAPGEKG